MLSKFAAAVHVHIFCLIYRATFTTTIQKVDHKNHKPTTLQLTNKVGNEFCEVDVSYLTFFPIGHVSLFQVSTQILQFIFSPPKCPLLRDPSRFQLGCLLWLFLPQILNLISSKQRSIKQTRAKTLHAWNIAFCATHAASCVWTIWFWPANCLAGPFWEQVLATNGDSVRGPPPGTKPTPWFFETHYAQLASVHFFRCVLFVHMPAESLQKLWQIVVWNGWPGFWNLNCIRKHTHTWHETLCFQTRTSVHHGKQDSAWLHVNRQTIRVCLQTACQHPICLIRSTSLRGGRSFGLHWIHPEK